MPTRKVYLPPQPAIDASVAGNYIYQLMRPEYEGAVEVEPYGSGAAAGELVNLPSGPVVVVRRGSPPPRTTHDALYVPGGTAPGSEAEYRSRGGRPKWVLPAPLNLDALGDTERLTRRAAIRESWRGRFSLREEQEGGAPGLRSPQIGAVFGVLSHWKVSSDPATVVMPTGTGKTDTMVALLVEERPECLLVVVPNDALRTQIAEKFEELGVLRRFGLLAADAEYPVVGMLIHKPKSVNEAERFFRACNVVVTTMNIAGQVEEDVQDAIISGASHLFVDEAHHLTAATWDAFRARFAATGKPMVQFTATPFRNDRRHVDGKVVFSYPLRKAQEEGYFKPIALRAVEEWDPDAEDEVIARAAVEQLEEDLTNGLHHVVMARAESIDRATKVHAIYRAVAPEYEAVLIHSQLTRMEQREVIRQIRSGEVHIIVSVGMLGEGFDLPELKIAALHEPHKSLAITLQFTGRFTRVRSDLGDATVVANVADPKVGAALRDLYAEDADWNLLLRERSAEATGRHARRVQFLAGFIGPVAALPLQNIFPKMSTVVYKTQCKDWDPDRVVAAIGRERFYAEPSINHRVRLAMFVTRDEYRVEWGALGDLRDVVHHLFLLHWDPDQKLLFVHSSDKDSLHNGIARAVAGDEVEIIDGNDVFRCLHDLHQLILLNIGLSNTLGGAIRFSMYAGPDAGNGLADALQRGRMKTNLFGRGYENGQRASIGCSRKGRIWSHRKAEDIPEWMDWCGHLGQKLLDTSIDVTTILEHVVRPTIVRDRPALAPIAIEWPEEFYIRDEATTFLTVAGERVPFFEAGLELTSHDTGGPIRFRVFTESRSVDYEMRFRGETVDFVPVGNAGVDVEMGRRSSTLATWFAEDPPPVRFANNSFLMKNLYFELRLGQQPAYLPSGIESWDWTGTDITKESQWSSKSKNRRTESVQAKVIQELLSPTHDPLFDVVFDDDGAGEAADVVAIAAPPDRLVIHLYHCKFAKSKVAAARVDELYAVCGQAQRSVHWHGRADELLAHLLRRDASRRKGGKATRFERGDATTVRALERRAMTLKPEIRIFVVQPGLSRAASNVDVLELLGATELHLRETYQIPLAVIGSP